MKRNIFRTAFPVCAFIACNGPPAPKASHSIAADISISVANETANEEAIFLATEAKVHRLGIVRAHGSRSFSVPSGLSDSSTDLRLEARRPSLPTIRSRVFRLSSGDRFVWVVKWQ